MTGIPMSYFELYGMNSSIYSRNKVTLVITSCGRFDLLQKTMSSFFQYNTYPIEQVIITDDSDKVVPDFVYSYHRNTVVINPLIKVGQIKSIDRAYEMVKTDLIFHCEDDWLFLRGGFIEESLKYIIDDPHVITVWLRDRNVFRKLILVNGHFDGYYSSKNCHWNSGFTFNPGLRRLKDYELIGTFDSVVTFDPKCASNSERQIGLAYKAKGYYGEITERGYIDHIGDTRHVIQCLSSIEEINAIGAKNGRKRGVFDVVKSINTQKKQIAISIIPIINQSRRIDEGVTRFYTKLNRNQK